ncbi:MAG: T9SS type A sorting domain-containing protein [Salinibacter sp.]
MRTITDAVRRGRRERRVDFSGLSSGVYFLRLRAGSTVVTERVTVAR